MIWTVASEFGPLVVREQIEPEDEPGILDLFASCDDWFEAVTGGPSGPGDVQSLFYSLPEGASFEDKRLFTVRDGDKIVGLIDSVFGYPRRRACAVGTFLIAPSHRRAGLGTAVVQVLTDEARALGIEEITTTANDTWPPGSAFLRSLGFVIGEPSSQHDNRTVWPQAGQRRATLAL